MIIDELIEALETTDRPSRGLDARIAWPAHPGARGEGTDIGQPHYTSSLDAAITLVPEGCGWAGRSDGDFNVHDPRFGMLIIGEGMHDIPAIALCIAALKAIKHQRAKEVA